MGELIQADRLCGGLPLDGVPRSCGEPAGGRPGNLPRWRRRLLCCAAALVCGLGYIAATPVAATGSHPLDSPVVLDEVTLNPNSAHFLAGPLLHGVLNTSGSSITALGADSCRSVENPHERPVCWEFGLTLKFDEESADEGLRLRVGMRLPRGWTGSLGEPQQNRYAYELFDPQGDRRAQGRETQTSRTLGAEATVLLTTTDSGRWRLRGWSQAFERKPPEVADLLYRVKLEPRPRNVQVGERLLPNLRPEPPAVMQFKCGPPHLPPHVFGSQSPEEPPPDGYTCLRYQIGYHNAGLGRFDVKFTPVGLEAEATQLVYCRDDTPWDAKDDRPCADPQGTAPAGVAKFHATHAHYHYENTLDGRLHRVDRRSDPPTLIGDQHNVKTGICSHNHFMTRFDRFIHEPFADSDSGNTCVGSGLFLEPQNDVHIALGAGWGDAYLTSIPDNYVPYPVRDGIPVAGEWVFRQVVDGELGPDNKFVPGPIVETSKHDNIGYTHFSVDEMQVITVHERGRGLDPWDPDKVRLERLGD